MLEPLFENTYRQFLVDPIAKKIKKIVSANLITLFAGLLGVLIIPALFYQKITLAVFLLLVSGYFDSLDGTLARHAKKDSPFGAVLDITVDRLVEFSIILGLWFFDPSRSLLCISMLGSVLLCVTSFLVVGVFTNNHSEKSFHYSPGIIERVEAFIFFFLMILLPSYFTFLAITFIALVLLTTLVRLCEFYQAQHA